MLVGSPVWIRNPEFKDPSVDDLWISSNVESTVNYIFYNLIYCLFLTKFFFLFY